MSDEIRVNENNINTIIKSNKDIKNFIKMTDEFVKFYYPSMV